MAAVAFLLMSIPTTAQMPTILTSAAPEAADIGADERRFYSSYLWHGSIVRSQLTYDLLPWGSDGDAVYYRFHPPQGATSLLGCDLGVAVKSFNDLAIAQQHFTSIAKRLRMHADDTRALASPALGISAVRHGAAGGLRGDERVTVIQIGPHLVIAANQECQPRAVMDRVANAVESTAAQVAQDLPICSNPRLDDDDDQDGVRNYRDLCPNEPGKRNRAGAPAYDGCATTRSWIDTLQTKAEALARQQVQSFLDCAGLANAGSIGRDLDFAYGIEGPQYENGTITFGDPSAWRAFWRAEMEAKCLGRLDALPSGETIWDDLYHELGHYYADALGLADVEGAGADHDTWKNHNPTTPDEQYGSNPGTAFDEAHADFIMLMTGRHLGRPLHERNDYGFARFEKESIPADKITITEGAITSLWLDVLPVDDPCQAMHQFLDVQLHWLATEGEAPQSFDDWVRAFNRHTQWRTDHRMMTTLEHLTADLELGAVLRQHRITPPVGSMCELSNPSGVRKLTTDGRTKTITLDGHVVNSVSTVGPDVSLEVVELEGGVPVTPPAAAVETAPMASRAGPLAAQARDPGGRPRRLLTEHTQCVTVHVGLWFVASCELESQLAYTLSDRVIGGEASQPLRRICSIVALWAQGRTTIPALLDAPGALQTPMEEPPESRLTAVAGFGSVASGSSCSYGGIASSTLSPPHGPRSPVTFRTAGDLAY